MNAASTPRLGDMRRRLPISIITCVLAAWATASGEPASASPLAPNEYITDYPTGCSSVRKIAEGTFRYVQTCSRGRAGEWEQVITAIDTGSQGVIFIPRQTLVNGIEIGGYWCSGAAPGASQGKIQSCTQFGWQEKPHRVVVDASRHEALCTDNSLECRFEQAIQAPVTPEMLQGSPEISNVEQERVILPSERVLDAPVALPAASKPTQKPLSRREISLLQRIRATETETWRTYGVCRYNWSAWRLYPNGIRATSAECGDIRFTIGVSCSRLLISSYTNDAGWSRWRRPAGEASLSNKGEDEMTAALCANISK